MGADGGLCWVKVTGDMERFQKLVEPFGFLYYNDYHDEYHDRWIDENGDPGAEKGVVVATYGTSQVVDGLQDLQEVLESLLEYAEEPQKPWVDNYAHMTFEEALLAIITRPKKTPLDYTIFPYIMDDVLRDSMLFWYLRKDNPDNHYIWEPFEHLLPMNILDWAKEVSSLIDMTSFGWEETWT